MMNIKISNAKLARRTSYVAPPQKSITIPVVFYIVYSNYVPNSDVSDSRVINQLGILNDKFQSTGIKFCLAGSVNGVNVPMKTVYESQAIPGIIHINNSNLTNHLTNNDQYSGQDVLIKSPSVYVSKDDYLRIWVVNSINGEQSGVLGYSWMPSFAYFDGIVLKNSVFGTNAINNLANYNEGETLIHQVGHYLGLYHTYEGGCASTNNNDYLDGDKVPDTPKVASPNYNCANGTNSCNESPPINDLIHNYMDEGNDICKESFTDGQKERMLNVINFFKSKLISRDNIVATGTCGSNNTFSAKITPNKYAVCSNDLAGVSFSSSSAVSHYWDFGDGTTSTLQNPNHVYNSTTNSPYTVTLTVSGYNSIGELVYDYNTIQIFATDCNINQINYNKNWYLPKSNSLKFNSNPPQYDNTFPINRQINNNDKGSSICDDSGNLLFYSNGRFVYNKFNNAINTSSLTPTSTETINDIFIVKKPGSSIQYILFINSSSSGVGLGFRYYYINIVNGIATSVSSLNLLPVNLGYSTQSNGAIKITSIISMIKKCNDSYWLLFTSNKSNNSNYVLTYNLSSTGINFEKEKALTVNQNTYLNGIIKASPNGNKVFIYNYYNNSPTQNYIADFDKTNGDISNLKNINNIYGGTYISASFSPDSNLLYTIFSKSSYYSSIFEIYQYNINSNTFNETKTIVGSYSTTPYTSYAKPGLQLGSDENLYFNYTNIIPNANKLGVIYKANAIANLSNFNSCSLSYNGPGKTINPSNNLDFGLPNMLDATSEKVYDINNKISKYSIGCNKYKFFPNVCGSTFKWEFINILNNNTVTLNETTPEYEFVPGNYTIKLKDAINNSELAEIPNFVISSPPSVTIVGSSSACTVENSLTNNSIVLTNDQTVVWTITGGEGTITDGQDTNASVNVNWTTLPGQLTATVMNANGCISEATKTISDACPCDCLSDLELVRTGPIGINSCDWYVINNSTDPRCANLNLRNSWYIDFQPQGNGLVLSNRSCDSAVGVTVALMNQTNSFSYCNISFGMQNPESRLISDKSKKNSRDIFISPNPSTGLYNVMIDDFIGKVSMQVVDINGRVVLSQTDADFNNETTINLSQFQSGVYILKVNANDLNYTEKLIKN